MLCVFIDQPIAARGPPLLSITPSSRMRIMLYLSSLLSQAMHQPLHSRRCTFSVYISSFVSGQTDVYRVHQNYALPEFPAGEIVYQNFRGLAPIVVIDQVSNMLGLARFGAGVPGPL